MSATIVEPKTTPEYKVFIGNLSFKTTKEGLCSFAESTGIKVVEATIIAKGPNNRSLGYGFVTFATEDDMSKAAVELNKKELDGREINVEVARPKASAAATTESTDDAPRKRSTRRKSKTPKKKNVKEESSSDEVKPSQPKKQQVSKKAQEPKDTSSDTSEDLPTHRQTPKKKRSKQQKKVRSPSDDRPSSKTTLFVANLPYATTDDDIKDLFKGYKVVSAHVTRMNNGRSKGYGFAEFEDEEEQQKALQNVKDIQLDGRAVYLKVALSTDEVSKKVEALDINDTKK